MSSDEFRALQADQSSAGGYLVTPTQIVAEYILDLRNYLFLRKLARTFTLDKAESLGVPDVSSEVQDPTWKGEIEESDLDTEMRIEGRELFPHRLPLGIKVSNKLLRIGGNNPEDIAKKPLTYKASAVQENTFLNGSGQMQPLGVFIPIAAGISTARD